MKEMNPLKKIAAAVVAAVVAVADVAAAVALT